MRMPIMIVAMAGLAGLAGCASSSGVSGRGLDETRVNAVLDEVERDAGPGVETTSRLGRSLSPMPLAPDVERERTRQLDAAIAAVDANPSDEDALIWWGRRTAYLGHYREAVRIFTAGLRQHPGSVRLLRHRGHRWITLRRFAEAEADLAAAAAAGRDQPDAVEPDGLPNRRGIPTSTTKSNVFYHLGLARYLQGDFDGAADAYARGQAFATNPDMACAMSYWQFLALWRAGRDAEAAAVLVPFHAGVEVIENTTYRDLLLLFKGVVDPAGLTPDADNPVGVAIDDATGAYGRAMWHWREGREDQAFTLLARIVEGPAWPAFGFIAAEVELARRGP
ncbi:MAG: hypothetical protein HKO59_15690 [Phycisphaerales bacterium]|nr:hypothetical protein [Phycisphaerae bacterium]NNF44291.1 hypothetical protein [Phycisphaerales bacterium]NNM27397.1 hypothetical protein [Phycisphaerales bacterium]